MEDLFSFNLNQCLVCRNALIKNFISEISSRTKVPISLVLEKIVDKVPQNACICEECFKKLNQLDEFQQKAESLRNELINIYNETKSATFNEAEFNELATFDLQIECDFNDEIQSCAKIQETDEIAEDFKKIINEEGIEYNYDIFQRTFNGSSQSNRKNYAFYCEECGIGFKSLQSTLVHEASNHGKIKDNLKCPTCGKVYSDKNSLRAHLISHKTDRKFHCFLCDKKFLYKISYTQHINIHNNVRKYSCSYESCNYKAINLNHIKRHERAWHTKEKNHKCDYCGKCFAERYNMNSHIRKQHRSERNDKDV